MEFNSNKPIYLQICDMICERILSGDLHEEDRIPSVREFGGEIGVNPNTIMRSYERLTDQGIIYNKRGIGYFVSMDAHDKILEANKVDFLEQDLPEVIKRMKLLEITLEEFTALYNK